MWRRTNLSLFALLVGSILFVRPTLGRSDLAPLEARLRREAPAAWARLEQPDDSLELEGTLRTNLGSTAIKKFHFAQSGGRIFLEVVQEPKNPGKVFCKSGERSFILDRRRPGNPYVITSLGQDSRNVVPEKIDLELEPSDRRLIQEPIGLKLSTLLTDPRYQIVGVESVQHGDRDLIQLRCSWSPDAAIKARGGRASSTEVLLDPSHQWVPIAATFLPADGLGNTKTYEYGPDEHGMPTLNKYNFKQKFIDGSGKPGESWDEYTFTRFSRDPIPPEKFTLAYFGLPELDEPLRGATGSGSQLWFLGFGCLFAAVAILTRMRRRSAQ